MTAVSIQPLDQKNGAELLGLDLAHSLSPTVFATVYQAYLDYGFILIRGQQHITHLQYTAFAARFDELTAGYPQSSGHQRENNAYFQKNTKQARYEHPDNPYIFLISNIKEQGRPVGLAKAGQYWHSDLYFTERPAHSTTLFSQIIPSEGGDTLLMNMYEVYQALPEPLQHRLNALHICLSYYRAWPHIYPTRAPMSREDQLKTPDVVHSLVQTHPQSRRPVLYLGALFSDENPGVEIKGLPWEEGRALYAQLRDFALQERFIYRHRWQVGDLLVMDNRCCMHSGTAWDDIHETRLLYRTTGLGAKTGRAINAVTGA